MVLRGFVAGDRILQSTDSHADWCASYGHLGLYKFIAASAIGKQHIKEMTSRDDAFAIRSSGVWLAIAVSDGAGSRKLSRYGSSYAVDALCEYMLRESTGIDPQAEYKAEDTGKSDEKEIQNTSKPGNTWDNLSHKFIDFFGKITSDNQNEVCNRQDVSAVIPSFDIPVLNSPSNETTGSYGTMTWQRLSAPSNKIQKDTPETIDLATCVRHSFQRTRQGIELFARNRGLELREFHCTLLGLLLNTETGEIAAGQIGDGLIASLHPGLGAYPFDAPSPGEVSVTYFLTQEDWEKYLAIRVLSPKEVEGIITFYLMSDGVAEDCTHPPPKDILNRWAQDINREMRKEEPLPQRTTKLLRWLANYEVKGSWDDRTLVVIMRD